MFPRILIYPYVVKIVVTDYTILGGNMGNVALIDKKGLVDNPTTRVPICLCLDVSGSMGRVIGGDYRETGIKEHYDGEEWEIVEGGISLISKLQEGVELFYDAIRSDDIARYSADVAIVTFADDAKVIQNFRTLDDAQVIPKLEAGGETAMGKAVNLSLDMLEQRKEQYKEHGVSYWQPWLVLMTDGQPQDPNDPGGTQLNRAISRTVELINNRKLTIFPIGIWDEGPMTVLQKFSPKKPPLKLKGTNFKEFFEWLSKSVTTISNSSLGTEVKLDVDGIRSWAEL